MTADDSLSGKCVLLAEDEVLIAMLFETALTDLGAVVICAQSVAEALGLIDERGGKLDVALLDGNLSGEAVFPVADRLSGLGIPFVFLTGYETPRFTARYPAARVLRKPVSVPVLGTALRACLTGDGIDC